MEQRISGREIMLFITMFKLWDAYLETDIHSVDNEIELRAPGYGCDECSYTLYANGKYEIEAWVPEEDEGSWELVRLGNIFDEVKM